MIFAIFLVAAAPTCQEIADVASTLTSANPIQTDDAPGAEMPAHIDTDGFRHVMSTPASFGACSLLEVGGDRVMHCTIATTKTRELYDEWRVTKDAIVKCLGKVANANDERYGTEPNGTEVKRSVWSWNGVSFRLTGEREKSGRRLVRLVLVASR